MSLLLGRWRDVLGDAEPDAIICDPPYSARTCKGQRSAGGDGPRAKITYVALSEQEQHAFAEWAAARTRRWVAICCDHAQVPLYDAIFGADASWLTFAPVPIIKRGAAPRMGADGPPPHAEWLYVARRRRRLERSEKRARKGWYEMRQVRGAPLVGTKALDTMREIVRDYSEPGDLVVDPFAGLGTTLSAALLEGRRALGSEVDPATHAAALQHMEKRA